MNTYRATLTLTADKLLLFRKIFRNGKILHKNPFTILLRGEDFLATRVTLARDRGTAVYQVVQYFWARFNGKLGPAHLILTVDDPCREVVYSSDIKCSDRNNNYLPQEVRDRVIAESNGVLTKGGDGNGMHHPPRSLMLVKRRRKLPFSVRPHLYKDANGTFFFSVITSPQITHNGRRYRKRAVTLVRLNARKEKQAFREAIHERGLLSVHFKNARKIRRTRRALLKKWA